MIFFLLVCLFLCSACGQKKMTFVADESLETKVWPEESDKALETKARSEESDKALEIKTSTEALEETKDSEKFKEAASNTERINLNTATREELMTLPWIGEVRADAIISYRETIGIFQQITDVMNVRGIKQGIFSKISSFICVE